MSQPEVEFEFDPPEFLSDKARSPQAPEKLNILKHMTAAGLLVAASIGIVSLFYGDVNERHSHASSSQKKDPPCYRG